MGVLLRGEQGDFAVNNKGWAMLLRLAWDYGWRPGGTGAPAHWTDADSGERTRAWNPADYVTGRGQRVAARDAALLAETLASILDDLPNHDPLDDPSVLRISCPGFPSTLFVSASRPINAFELFGGTNKAGFQSFLAFCRGGGFSIW